MKFLLWPLSYLYSQIIGVRNSLYDRKVLSVYTAPVPIISIGNLTVGGTGKTPITDFCIKAFIQAGKKVAVISRSYKAEASSPSLVDVSHPFAARYYGDEPVLLAQLNPKVSVFVGPTKWLTARYAVSEDRFDVLIVDDGFQHRKLHRDLNILILDATESLENYEVLPEGRARESWISIERADLIIVSKSNLSNEEDLSLLKQRLPENKEVLFFDYEIDQCMNVKNNEIIKSSDLTGKKIFTVSAIARPDVFEKMMSDFGQISSQSMQFADHHQYTTQDVKAIEQAFKNSKADYLVTTEKDAVKLQDLFSEPSLLWKASLRVSERGQKGRLNEIISKLIR